MAFVLGLQFNFFVVRKQISYYTSPFRSVEFAPFPRTRSSSGGSPRVLETVCVPLCEVFCRDHRAFFLPTPFQSAFLCLAPEMSLPLRNCHWPGHLPSPVATGARSSDWPCFSGTCLALRMTAARRVLARRPAPVVCLGTLIIPICPTFKTPRCVAPKRPQNLPAFASEDNAKPLPAKSLFSGQVFRVCHLWHHSTPGHHSSCFRNQRAQ